MGRLAMFVSVAAEVPRVARRRLDIECGGGSMSRSPAAGFGSRERHPPVGPKAGLPVLPAAVAKYQAVRRRLCD